MDRWRRRKLVYRGKIMFYQNNYGPLQTGILRILLSLLSIIKMVIWLCVFILPSWRERARLEMMSNLDVLMICWALE